MQEELNEETQEWEQIVSYGCLAAGEQGFLQVSILKKKFRSHIIQNVIINYLIFSAKVEIRFPAWQFSVVTLTCVIKT